MIGNTNFLGRRCTIAAVIIFFKLNIFGNTYNIYLFPKLFLGSSNWNIWDAIISISRSCITKGYIFEPCCIRNFGETSQQFRKDFSLFFYEYYLQGKIFQFSFLFLILEWFITSVKCTESKSIIIFRNIQINTYTKYLPLYMYVMI